jgi:glycosyltransferase involved in cell wall biosynthesis
MTRPASIGIVMHDFPLGGTERIALRLARAWIGHGVAVTIFCGDAQGPLRALVPAGAALVAAAPPIVRATGSRERLGRAAARHFAAHRVDALFVTGNFHWEIVPALAAIPQRPAIVAQISSPLLLPHRGRFLQWRFGRRMRRLLGKADMLVAMDDAARALADGMMRRTVTHRIPLPALDDEAPPLSPATGRAILAAGRLIRQKGFDLLIDAVAGLDDPGATLTIVGTGPEEAALRRQIARVGLEDRATLAGYARDIRPYLDAARCFVLPSRFEGYGAVIVEALGAGRPVIATASTPAADDLLTEGERGIVVPVGDVAALTAALRTLLDRPPADPDRLADAVSPYRIGLGAKAYLDVFADAMARRRARA